jgi:hypothetical protein
VLRRLALVDPPIYQPVWSTAIVAEVWRVLTVYRLQRGDSATAIGASAHAMWQWLDPVMLTVPASAPPPDAPPCPLRDPRDEHLWNAALHANAAYIVSHNTRDFPAPIGVGSAPGVPLRHFAHGVEFLTAIEFVEDVLRFDAATLYGAPLPTRAAIRSHRSRR